MRINTTDLWNLMRLGNQFFSVTFERRTTSRNGSAQAGEMRTMLCRCGMSKYKKGVRSDAETDARDYRHGILTVWSMDAYTANRRRGMDKNAAAFAAWRCIDVVTVRKCSLLNHYELPAGVEADLPPDIVIGHHQITNEYRLNHMPRTPVAV
jgi:hypothetical protein